MRTRKTEIRKRTSYIFTEKQLRDLLGVSGRIIGGSLWQGLSPNQEDAGKSPDQIEWEIVTEETEVRFQKGAED